MSNRTIPTLVAAAFAAALGSYATTTAAVAQGKSMEEIIAKTTSALANLESGSSIADSDGDQTSLSDWLQEAEDLLIGNVGLAS